jgi:hypothetical protein
MQKEPKMLHYGNENHSRFLHATPIQEVLYCKKNNPSFYERKKNNPIRLSIRKIILLFCESKKNNPIRLSIVI